jgi:glutathione synthase/RimK-type ligase-like ATP-grasp enzyme
MILKSIGMLHYRKNPADVKKAYPYAAVAKMEGIPFYYFSFNSVDFINMKINGWIYSRGAWEEKVMEFPTVVINSCNPKTEKQAAIIKKLKEYALFTSYPVGNKFKVYKKLLTANEFSRYLIPSVKLNNPSKLFSLLDEYTKVVIKPFSGNQGKKVAFIERLNEHNQFKLTDGLKVKVYNQLEMEAFIGSLILEQKYLLQPFIECKTKSGLTYDFRLHIQKNGRGMWEITLIYPRISGSSKLISNISSGGYRAELEPFLKDEFGDESERIKALLEYFALSFSAHFDTLYQHSFDELGIDVGMDAQQKLWIFEVNWRPGCKHREFEVARRLIPYCIYLAKV